jgi:dUTP pyrophosphatase
MRRVLYLAEPIDQTAGPVEGVEAAADLCAFVGWLVYRPRTAWVVHKGTRPGHELESFNRVALSEAGALVAFLPSGVPTVGVPREIEQALVQGTPVVAVTDQDGWSLHDVDIVKPGDDNALAGWLMDAMAEAANRPDTAVQFTLSGDGRMPTRTNSGDAGYDLYTSRSTVIPPQDFVDIPCGVRVAFPHGVWGRITGRSSTLRNRQLLVAEGVIDTGYRGALYAGVWNLGSEPVTVERGDRIAQLLLHDNIASVLPVTQVSDEEFASIPGDSRGPRGFGSTGV